MRNYRIPSIIAILIALGLGGYLILSDNNENDEENNHEINDTLVPPPEQLTIATLNCYFLFDGINPEGQANFDHKGDAIAAKEHIREIGDVIREFDPDIINLVEVENKEVLDYLNDSCLGGAYFAYLIEGRDSYTRQDVCLLSKYEVESFERTDRREQVEGTTDDYGVSKNYIAKFEFDDFNLAIIGLHFLSRPNDSRNNIKREAQARVINQESFELAGNGYELIILGDFNDYDGVVLDVNNNTPLTDVLEVVKDVDPTNPDDDLVNVAVHLDQTERYTAHWDRNNNDVVDGIHEFSSIDHILVSSWINDNVDSVSIPHTYDPLDISDHFPVIVYLSLN